MTHLDPETLVAYWADDVPNLDDVETHLFACARCTRELERIAAIAIAIRALIPPVIDRATLDLLRRRGLRIVESSFSPGERREVVFREGTDILLHRLAGLSLADADRVELVVSSESSREILVHEANVPFDAEHGEVLIACQRHFSSMPGDVVFEVRAHRRGGPVDVSRYFVPHRF
jgi:hypothetical protein